jgi:hypothetical protein
LILGPHELGIAFLRPILEAEAETARAAEVVDGGWLQRRDLGVADVARLLFMSATIASADSPGPRSDQSFSVMKACAVFWPWPRKLKPVRKVTVSTPLRCARNSSTRFTTSKVRLNDASGGVCTSVVMKP